MGNAETKNILQTNGQPEVDSPREESRLLPGVEIKSVKPKPKKHDIHVDAHEQLIIPGYGGPEQRQEVYS
jgi:hypothetical protein